MRIRTIVFPTAVSVLALCMTATATAQEVAAPTESDKEVYDDAIVVTAN